jgi:hypothetical protein
LKPLAKPNDIEKDRHRNQQSKDENSKLTEDMDRVILRRGNCIGMPDGSLPRVFPSARSLDRGKALSYSWLKLMNNVDANKLHILSQQ